MKAICLPLFGDNDCCPLKIVKLESFYSNEFRFQNMESGKHILQLNQKNREFEKDKQLTLTENMTYVEISQEISGLYENSQLYPLLMVPLDIMFDGSSKAILVKSWGYQLSTLSQYQIQSFSKESWLIGILSSYINMKALSPRLSEDDIYIDNNEEPKFLPTSACSTQENLQNFRNIIKKMFSHINSILERSKKIKNYKDIEHWLGQLRPKREGKTIHKLIQLKNTMPKGSGDYKISLSEEQESWIISFTGYNPGAKMSLVYDGNKNNFDPAPLIQIAQKNQLLFLLQTAEGRRVAFWMSSKPEMHQNTIFGTYFADKSKKSVLLGLQKRSVHTLKDENYSVGFGNQILLSIGRVDIVLSAFNCSNVSYFPCSYSQDQVKGVKEAGDLLGKEFRLKQLEAYRIN